MFDSDSCVSLENDMSMIVKNKFEHIWFIVDQNSVLGKVLGPL